MSLETTDGSKATPRALDAATVAEAFQLTAADNAERTAIRTKDDEFSITWAGYAERVRRVAAGLAALGVRRGDTVGIMLTNRPEFHFADAGAMHLGATPFSIYNTSTVEQIEYVIGDAANRVLFTEAAFLDIVLEATGSAPALEHIVVVDGDKRDGTINLTELEAMEEPGFDFEAAWRAVEPGDLLTLIYTSGTTGPPKGVQLTHGSLVAAARSFDELITFPEGGRLISWLPMAHVAERNVTQYMPMVRGDTTTCCPDARQVAAYLTEVRPTWFFAVPRIWEKLKAAMEIGIGAEPDENRKKAVEWALDVGRRKVEAEQDGRAVSAELAEEYAKADELVLSKLRERVGLDQLEAVNVGAAPTPPEVIEFFHSIGVPLAELWGLSESCASGTCNPPGRIKIGTVGPPAPGVELELAEDGEVLLRGEILMAGYRNDPEKTAEAIDPDGWLHTGDVGEFDDDGYLRIVDRKKELIINAAGKNMSPASIEAKLKSASPLIAHAVAIGDARPYNVALIALDPEGLAARGAGADDAVIVGEIAGAVEAANQRMSRVEQIKYHAIIDGEWAPGGDELTPTLKLKRRPIERKYTDEIEALYAPRSE